MKKLNTAFILLLFVSSLLAQKKITGTVVDDQDIGLPGANVVIKGKAIGTITDTEGKFSLRAPEENDVIVFTFVGFKSHEVTYEGQEVIDVQMMPEELQLDEVVAIGYGGQRREDVTGAISTIKAGDIAESLSSASVENILQGKVAGLNVQFTSGEMGAAPVVLIRGLGAISRTNSSVSSSPLWVIDGVPVVTAGDEFGGQANPIADLDPTEIEDVTVLKDAASAAIYGSRAANGVILVTTRKGKPGRPQISLNIKSGVNLPGEFIETIGGAEERRFRLGLYEKYAPLGTSIPFMLTDSLNPYWNQSTDWQSEVFGTGHYESYNLSVKAAGDFGNYRVSLGHLNNQGTSKTSKYKKYNFGVNNTLFALNEKLRINTVLSFARIDNSRRVSDAEPSYTTSLKPAPDSPLLVGFSDREKARYINLEDILRSTLDLSYTHNNIIVKSALSFSHVERNVNQFNPFITDDVEVGTSIYASGRSPISKSSSKAQSLLWENTATYHKTIKSHFFEVLAGTSTEMINSKYVTAGTSFARNFFTESLDDLENFATYSNSGYSAYTIQGFIGRLNYKFKNKYLLGVSTRLDGSSKFGKDNRWGVFPAVSGGWIFTDENFMQSLKGFLNHGKLRVSWGQTGGTFGDNYLAQGILRTYRGYLGETSVTPEFNGGFKNDNLSWERSSQINVGFNLQFFNDRINLEGDYYYRKTKDLLLDIDLPLSSGYGSSPVNAADVVNYGFELTLNTTNIESNQFRWETNFNIASNENYVTQIYGGNEDIIRTSGASRWSIIRKGVSVNSFYFLNSTGIYQSREEVPVNPVTGEKLRYSWNSYVEGGDPIYIDVNKDFIIDNADRQILGNPNPRMIGGFNNMFYLGRFYATVYCKFMIGKDVINSHRINNLNNAGSIGSPLPNIYDIPFWQKPGDDAMFPSINPWKDNIWWDDATYIEDGSFFKISSVTLGYSFKKELMKKWNMRNLRVFTTIENLAIFQNYSGPNAEMIPLSGYDAYGSSRYPLPLKVLAGVTVEF